MLKRILTSSRLPWEPNAAAHWDLQAGVIRNPGAEDGCLMVSSARLPQGISKRNTALCLEVRGKYDAVNSS